MVDFTTYVFVPAYAVAAGGLVPPLAAIPLAIVIVVSGALYFADRSMKTTDNYFRGFPAVWNAPVFYLFLLRPDPWIAAAAIVLLAVLTFVPVPFLHPFRVRRFRTFSALLLSHGRPLRGRAPPRYVAGTLGDRRACAPSPFISSVPACCGARERSDMFELFTTPMPGRRWSP